MRFGHQGGVGLTFSRYLAKDTIATAGVANIMPWGTGARLIGKSYYGALTQAFPPLFPGKMTAMSASFGLGTGAFSPIGKLNSLGVPKAFSDATLYPFANASVNLTPSLAIIGDYYSETGAIGITYNVPTGIPFNVMLFAANLHHTREAPSTSVGLQIATGVPFPWN
jgi:hypothetical protein